MPLLIKICASHRDKRVIVCECLLYLPGTETKNLTASLCPWNDSCAWDMEQYGMKLPGITRSFLSEYTLTGPPGLLFSITSSIRFPEDDFAISGECKGTLMITPFPVPSQSRVQDTRSAVIRTKEKPSLPVPEKRKKCCDISLTI